MKQPFGKDEAGDDWIFPTRKRFKLICCDCGLAHELKFRLVPNGKGHSIEFKINRDERTTAQLRRHRKIKVKDGAACP